MVKIINPINNTDTFQVWLQRTNELVSELGTSIVTASPGGDTTAGNATLLGAFEANTVSTQSLLRTNAIDARVGAVNPIDIRSAVSYTSTVQVPVILNNSLGPRIRIRNANVSWLAGLRGSAGTGTNAQFIIGVEGADASFRIGVDGVVSANTILLDTESSNVAGAVRASRTITTQNGVTGGGDLTANRTIGLTGNALGLHNLAANGLVARTGDGTVSARTIGQGTGIAVTNGDGVSGNPSIALTGLAAAIHGISTNGMVIRTGTSTAVSRVLAQGEGIAITNTDGVSGNPTIALAGNALSLSTLATNGVVARTATGTITARTIAQGTGITVTNGDGVAGNPTIAATLASQAQAETGTDNTVLMTPLRVAQAARPILGTAAATTTGVGTFVDFGSIPAWVNRVTLVFYRVSLTSTGSLLVQLGTSAGLVTTGYLGGSWSSTSTVNTTGFVMFTATAAPFYSGVMVITRQDGNNWVATHTLTRSSDGLLVSGGSSVSLTAALTQLRVTNTLPLSNSFDGGSINIMWE